MARISPAPPLPPPSPPPTPSLSTQEARSGETSGHVRIILLVSLNLAIIGLLIVLALAIKGVFFNS
ncbi:MAG: hypothetical protein R3E60_03310 [Alphaproteobacteria bacterium]